jgi:hypothetical protein
MDDRLAVTGGCSCGCCDDQAGQTKTVDPAEERRRLEELKEQVDSRLSELEESESTP